MGYVRGSNQLSKDPALSSAGRLAVELGTSTWVDPESVRMMYVRDSNQFSNDHMPSSGARPMGIEGPEHALERGAVRNSDTRSRGRCHCHVVTNGMITKTLCSIGKSKGLILDRPILRLLGIGPRTKLRLCTDGRRLIVEPITEEPPAPTASELDALAVFMALVDRFGMSQSEFDQLHHQKMRIFAYGGSLQTTTTWTETERATIRRFEACLRALRQGTSWSDAITIALHAEPKPAHAEPKLAQVVAPIAPSVLLGTPADVTVAEPIDARPVDESLYREDVDEENPIDGVYVSLD
jgi:hypothetical protein